MPNYVKDYTQNFAPGFDGMLAESRGRNILSKRVETADVPFGRAVGAGSKDGSCKLSGTGFEGITVADRAQTTDGKYKVGAFAAVAQRGVVWCKVSAAVTHTSTVKFNAATGQFGDATGTEVTGAQYLDSVPADEITRVDLG